LIVIEASGVADPQGIIEALMDPVLWPAVLLDSVVCLVDAEDVIVTPERTSDPLWRAQVRTADIVQLSRVEGVESKNLSRLKLQLNAMGKRLVYGANGKSGLVKGLLGFGASNRTSIAGMPVQSDGRFETLEWHFKDSIPMAAFQNAIGVISPTLVRAKGFVCFMEIPGKQMVFQLVGQRATLAPRTQAGQGCALILIGEKKVFDAQACRAVLDAVAE